MSELKAKSASEPPPAGPESILVTVATEHVAGLVSVPQAPSVPVPMSTRSRTRSVQTPCCCLPSKRESWSFCGRKRPVYGAWRAMAVAASSSKTVLTKSSPRFSGPPGWLTRLTVVPSGPVMSMRRSPTHGWSMSAMRTSRSLIRPAVGTSMVDVTPVALSSGIASRVASVVVRATGWPATPVGRVSGTVWGPPAVVSESVADTSAPQAASLASAPAKR